MTLDALALAAARERLTGARHLLFITGAGISADSGIPTYRGVGGLYEGTTTQDDLPIEVCLSGGMFRREPARTWNYLLEIERACRGAVPNAAHVRIAELERELERVWVLTQNVDGLHALAGTRNLIEIHGTLHALHCTRCAWSTRTGDYASLEPLPRCPACRAVIRPRVVLFDEMLPLDAVELLERELGRGFDAVIVIGTSAGFPYIAAPVAIASREGKPTIEINPGLSALSSEVDIHIRMGAAAGMQALFPAQRSDTPT